MTLAQALQKAAAAVDTLIDRDRARFEQSLVDHYSPDTDLDVLLCFHDRTMQAWRERTLATVREQLRASCETGTLTTPDEARCPYCLEDVLTERDPVTQRYFCLVCAKTWPAPHVQPIDSRPEG